MNDRDLGLHPDAGRETRRVGPRTGAAPGWAVRAVQHGALLTERERAITQAAQAATPPETASRREAA